MADRTFHELGKYPKDNERVDVIRLKWIDGVSDIDQRFLNARRLGRGTVRAFVPTHGGDAWSVEHDDGAVAVYWIDELAPVT